MDTSSLSTNTLDTSCFGTFQVSSDSFSSCVQMTSSPTSSNSDKTFTITPKNNLSYSTVFRIRITTGTKDSSWNSLTSQWNTSSGFQTVADTTPPTLTAVTVVTNPTNDNTPNYIFSSSEAGTITYGGSCSSGITSATSGNNTITLISLSDGTYSNCTITVTDSAGNASSSLTMNSFIVDATSPTVSSTSPSDSASSVSIGSTISVTFSESIDNSSVTANTSNTTCSGSMQLSSNNFSSCIQMSSTPSASNTNKTFSVTPSDNLSSETSYKTRITTGVSDLTGNTLGSTYTTSSGFTTADITAPTLSPVTTVSTPTNDNTSSYTFSSTEAGTITYGGSCSSDNTSATTDNNTVTFNALADGTYDDCTIKVTDSASNSSSTLDVNTFVVDTIAPGISGSDIRTPTNDTTPDFRFSSSEAGTVTFGGSCSSSTTSAIAGTITVTFNTLSDGIYSDCTITVTDSAGNASNTHSITSFLIDTTAPTVSSTYPTDNQSGVSITDNISVTFSEAMYFPTTNTDNTTCYGSFALSSDNFSSCVQMSSSTSSNSDKTFTIDPSDNLSYSTTYKIRVSTGVKDSAGNTLSSQYETSSGFTTLLGTQQFGTSSTDFGNGVVVDSSNNIYVTGFTAGGLDNNTNSGSWDIILVKYNSSGTKQWTKQLGTSNLDSGEGVTVDSSDNIYVTGFTEGGLDNNTNSGSSDIFLVKYNSAGTKQWTKQFGTSSNDSGSGVVVDSSDNVYVTGYTEGGLDNNPNYGGRDIVLVKYNSSGTKQWTQQLGNSMDQYGSGVVVDSSDNVYVTGYTEGGLDNINWGRFDIFLVKYNSSGTKQWTKQLSTVSDDLGLGVTVDSSDNIYVTGWTNGGLDGSNSGEADIILVKYTSSGTKQWTKQLGSTSREYGQEVTVDSSDNVYVTGYTYGGLDGNTNLGSSDIILVKYNYNGTKQWTQQLGSSSSESGHGVTVDSSDNIYVTGSTSGALDGNTNSGGGDLFLVKFNSDGVKQ